MIPLLPGPLISKFLSIKLETIISIFLINGALYTDQMTFTKFLELSLSMAQRLMDMPFFTNKKIADY